MRIATLLQRQADESLSQNQHIFRAVWDLEAEVNNGGFHQYFFNASGHKAAHAPDALAVIGAFRCAEIVARALVAASAVVADWQDDRLRREQLEELGPEAEDELAELDTEFYQYPDNLSDLLTSFVTAHPGDFTD